MKMRSLLLLLSMTLAGCASKPPSQIVLAPSVPQFISENIEAPAVSLQVIDRRNANFIVRQDSTKTENRLVAPSVPPADLIQKVLIQALKTNDTAVTPQAPIKMTVYVDKLLADVTQETFDYKVKSIVSLSMKVTKGRHYFNNSYQVTGNMTGSLQLDYSQLEVELNKLIDQATSDLLNDPQLALFISSSDQ